MEKTVNTTLHASELTRYNPWDGIIVTPISGDDHGLEGMSVILGETQPGGTVPIHSHAHQEIFIVTEGCGRWTIDGVRQEAAAGDIVIVPANTPHTFSNTGTEMMRHASIHPTGRLGPAISRNMVSTRPGYGVELDG